MLLFGGGRVAILIVLVGHQSILLLFQAYGLVVEGTSTGTGSYLLIAKDREALFCMSVCFSLLLFGAKSQHRSH